VQAIDRWVGTRGARLVLVDDTGTRAIMTAHWLKQLGWDVQILDRTLEGAVLETGSDAALPAGIPTVPVIEAADAARWLKEGATAVSLEPSSVFRQAHPAGAVGHSAAPRSAWGAKGRSHCPVFR
jgi:hypothetical protein